MFKEKKFKMKDDQVGDIETFKQKFLKLNLGKNIILKILSTYSNEIGRAG